MLSWNFLSQMNQLSDFKLCIIKTLINKTSIEYSHSLCQISTWKTCSYELGFTVWASFRITIFQIPTTTLKLCLRYSTDFLDQRTEIFHITHICQETWHLPCFLIMLEKWGAETKVTSKWHYCASRINSADVWLSFYPRYSQTLHCILLLSLSNI